MRFYRPVKVIESKIQKPIERIAILSLIALGVALAAFFLALAKADGIS